MPRPEVVIAVDCGTHAVRCLVFGADTGEGHIVHNEELRLCFPEPGSVEIDPEGVAAATVRAVRSAVAWAREHGATPIALGLTNMRETAFCWRREDGRPAAPGLMWMSLASEPVVQVWREKGYDPLIRHKTGLSNHSFFFGSKIAWLFDREPALAAAAETGSLQVGTLDSWLAYRLSGGTVHATDVSNASRYQLLDLRSLSWDRELSQVLGIPLACLPDVMPTMAAYGVTSAELCGAEVPITCLFADQQASLFGHGCESAGDVKATFGTSGVVCLNAGGSVAMSEGLVTSVAWTDESGSTVYEVEGSAFHCGYTLGWLSGRLGEKVDWSAPIEATEAPLEDRLFVLPSFTSLGAPRWPSRRGAAIIGLAMDTSPADIMRAGVEAMAYQVNDLFEAMDPQARAACDEIVVDGGGAANDFLCQMLADLSLRKVVRPDTQEVTSVGAAKGALRGLDRSVDPYFGQDRSRLEVFHPRPENAYAREGYRRWVELVEAVLR